VVGEAIEGVVEQHGAGVVLMEATSGHFCDRRWPSPMRTLRQRENWRCSLSSTAGSVMACWRLGGGAEGLTLKQPDRRWLAWERTALQCGGMVEHGTTAL
jgi:hypothetical protein